nr:MAG TPA: hypothetical protein [Caudoviricetes sp.]
MRRRVKRLIFYAFFRQALKKRIPETEWPGRENE